MRGGGCNSNLRAMSSPILSRTIALIALAIVAALAATNRYKVPGGWPDSIANGPDGALWVGQGNIGQVARLDVSK